MKNRPSNSVITLNKDASARKYKCTMAWWLQAECRGSKQYLKAISINYRENQCLMAALSSYAIEPLKMSAIKLLGSDNFLPETSS